MEKTRLIFILSGTALLIYLLNKEEEKKESEPEPLYTKKEPETMPLYAKKEPETMPLYAKIGIGAIPIITAAFIGGKIYSAFKPSEHNLTESPNRPINISNLGMYFQARRDERDRF